MTQPFKNDLIMEFVIGEIGFEDKLAYWRACAEKAEMVGNDEAAIFAANEALWEEQALQDADDSPYPNPWESLENIDFDNL